MRPVPFGFPYTTPSHTEEHHRFRAVFLLDETITDAKVWADCLYGLAIRLGSDRAIKDAGRMFFGSLEAEVIEIGGRLPACEVDKLVTLAQDERILDESEQVISHLLSETLRDRVGMLDDDGNPSFDEDDPLLNIAAHVMVAQRSSQNKIVSLFERLRQSNGWDIEKVEKLPKAASDRKWKDAQRDIKERRIQGILSARELDDSEYIELAAARDKGTKLFVACLQNLGILRCLVGVSFEISRDCLESMHCGLAIPLF